MLVQLQVQLGRLVEDNKLKTLFRCGNLIKKYIIPFICILIILIIGIKTLGLNSFVYTIPLVIALLVNNKNDNYKYKNYFIVTILYIILFAILYICNEFFI